MTDQSDPITSSLARVYADQGHLRKAALIYQRLLSTAPDCREYAVALEAIESQLSRSTEAGSEEETALVDRFRQWIELAQGNSRIEQLLALRSGGSSR